jgi:hypothetical protein
MKVFRSGRGWALAWAGVLLMALAPSAWAQVSVIVDGDTAIAEISLTDGGGTTYDAEVTIIFDTPQNLSPQSLNLTAELVDPDGPVAGRIPGGTSISPEFPMMITVEPPDIPWLFASGFDGGGAEDVLGFLNTYEIEIHTHALEYTSDSTYRLMKAPVGGDFADITSELAAGSMRARGRGPAFSQFVIVDDQRVECLVTLDKVLSLQLRIVGAILGDALRLDLLRLLAKVGTLIFIDLDSALAALDELIGEIHDNAGTEIANVWTAHRDVENDAGDLLTDAQTLRFSMQRLPPILPLICLLNQPPSSN